MSIIYDALNKTQQIRELKNKKETQNFSLKWLMFSISLIFLFCILLLLFFLFRQPEMTPVVVKKRDMPIAQKLPSSSYVLSGVFISNNQQLAIINHRYYHVGDQIDGMNIIGMNINEVKLKDKDHVLILPMLH